MTDDQLDQALQAASTDLLRQIATTADSIRTLTAIMARTEQKTPAATPVSAMIKFRDTAHNIASALTLAPTSARDLDDVRQLVSDLGKDFIPDLASDPVRVLERIVDIAGARRLSLDLLYALDEARCLAVTSADLPAEIDRTFTKIPRVLNQRLSLGLDLRSGFAWEELPNSHLYQARILDNLSSCLDLNRYVAEDLGHVASILVSSALDRARVLAQHLDSHELDASGEDLSQIEIRHLDAVDGVTWTRETIWPLAIASYVEDHSCEIRLASTRSASETPGTGARCSPSPD